MGIFLGDIAPDKIFVGGSEVASVWAGNIKLRPTEYPHFATQGPAPDGFHVPLSSERQAVYNSYISLGLSGVDNFKNYLKLPAAGYRINSNSNVSMQNTYGEYRSSSAYGDNSRAYGLQFYQTINPSWYAYRSYGISIRPFKNKAVIPNNSRTVLYQGSGSAGIYHNSSLGFISISSDGENWITIADKNLGATTVWNSGDTLSEANCGKYYQWGNNYGFPRTGSLTTTSTQVNASDYGPGNYYNSSTFIRGSRWDNSDNRNLRGGVSGNVPVS